jgi:acyl carrier protein
MTASQILDATFREALGMADGASPDGAAYGRTGGWDSVGHMQLIVGLETAFGISVAADDVFEMSTFEAVRRILRDRYAVDLGDR